MDDFYGGNVFAYNIEPTSPKGLHRYVDLASMLPSHIQGRKDLMQIVYLFQDYLNDGYREIPKPTTTYTYKKKANSKCDSATIVEEYFEYARPLNHTPSMYKKKLTSGYEYAGIESDPIEEYDKERDLDTWAIDFDTMDAYKAKYSSNLFGGGSRYSYYNEPRQYRKILEFYNAIAKISKNNPSETNIFEDVYIYVSESTRNQRCSLDEASMTLAEIKSLIATDIGELPEIEFYYFACDAKSFKRDFSAFEGNSEVKFRVESRKVPYFYGIGDANDYNESPHFASDSFSVYSDLTIDESFNSSFRVSFKIDGRASSSQILSMLNLISPDTSGSYSMKILPKSMIDVSHFVSGDFSVIASALLVIKEYQHPEVFYSEFGGENDYRHEKKGASIAEKIYRLAYAKDASVFDYDYVRLIAHHFGYSIETDEEEINQNSYYKTKADKEEVLRQLIAKTPEYNRMKGCDSGIEMVLLSFGLVGRIVTLYTRGDDKRSGYVDFIDGRLVSGDIEEYADAIGYEDPATPDGGALESTVSSEMSAQFTNDSKLGNTSPFDWYASPHFRIEFDILKDYLNIARSSDAFSTIAKTVRRIKPINTVFQGFYAKLNQHFGTMFINPPTGMQRVHQKLAVQHGCEFIDSWTDQCAMEIVNAG